MPGKVAQLEFSLAELSTKLDAARDKIQQLFHEQQRIGENYQAQRARLIRSEIARRQAECDQREAELRGEQSLLDREWHDQCQQLPSETPRPAARTHEAIQAARIAWQQQLQQDEARLSFAHQWVACLEGKADFLPLMLTEHVNLVAVPISGLADDVYFGDTADRAAHFDMLIVDEAHEVREAEFLKAAPGQPLGAGGRAGRGIVDCRLSIVD